MKDLQDQLAEYMDRRKLTHNYEKVMHDTVRYPEVLTFLSKHKAELKPEAVEKSASKLYEFVREKQKAERGEVGLVPGYVPELVISNGLIDVSYVPSNTTRVRNQQNNLARRVMRINMPKDIEQATLAGYTVTPGRKDALVAAQNFVHEFSENPMIFHKGLYLHGAFGVGKTYLLGAIANALAQAGYSSLMLHFPTLSVEMKGAIKDNSVTAKIESIKRTQILMLDDMGADTSNAWIRDDILGVILQYRMQEQLPTFFTSNFAMAELEQYLGDTAKGYEPIKASRIMERIRYLSTEISVAGVNRRFEK